LVKQKPEMTQESPKNKFDELRLQALNEAVEPGIDREGLELQVF
jgi:hypothetical protein